MAAIAPSLDRSLSPWSARRSSVGAGASRDALAGSRAKAVGGPTERKVSEPKLDDVVIRAQAGDAAAFSELFRQHRSVVTGIAYRMLGPNADLEDVVQDVFLQVHRSLPAFRGQAKFTTWLHRVTVNVVLMTRRRARSRPQYTHEEAARHEPTEDPSPDQDVARRRRVEAFRALLDKLSDKKRTVFILHELEGMPPSEIAEVVECPVLTVRTRLFYARKELAEMMRNEPSLSGVADLGQREKQRSEKGRQGKTSKKKTEAKP